MFMIISIKLLYFYYAPCKPAFSTLPHETPKVLACNSRPACPLDVPESIKGFSVCVRAFIALSLPSYLDHQDFLSLVLDSLFLSEMLPIFLQNFLDLEDIVLNPAFCIDL